MNLDELPETLREATVYFSDPICCHDFLVAMRWPDGLVCPRCGSKEIGGFIASRRLWNCKGCRKQFTAKVGTIFEDSPLGLDMWLPAVWLIVNAKNGISSCELHRALGVTQKTAWFMLHRIRLALQDGFFGGFGGTVEVDETFIGAKARNMHAGKRKVKGTGPIGKTPVVGVLQRAQGENHSKVHLRVAKGRKKPELQKLVREIVHKGAEVNTDALRSYDGLAEDYVHQVIDHLETYAKGTVHTNGLENFWSLLKRGLKGTYVNVEPFHLFRYCDEQAFRFNQRKDDDRGRFVTAMQGVIGKGIRYARLIGKDQEGGGDCPPTTGAWATV
jgi:transposase-like protein